MHELPFQTLTQFVALGLTLVAGWLLGLASASGGRKWRDRYYDEEMNNAGYRDQAESDLRDAARRIRDLEAENARLRTVAPAAAEAAPVVAVQPQPVREEGHSTAALAGAAVAGAAAGAVAAYAAHEHHDAPAPAEPVAAAHAEPAHAEPAHVEPAPAAHDSHRDAHPAPADSHNH